MAYIRPLRITTSEILHIQMRYITAHLASIRQRMASIQDASTRRYAKMEEQVISLENCFNRVRDELIRRGE